MLHILKLAVTTFLLLTLNVTSVSLNNEKSFNFNVEADTLSLANNKNSSEKLGAVADPYTYDDREISDAYVSVMKSVEEAGSSAYITFDFFKQSLQSRSVDIESFSIAMEQELLENEAFYNNKTRGNDLCGLLTSSSEDADYIINSTESYVQTPVSCFKRDLYYNGYNGKTFDYRSLQPGDIIYENVAPFGHSAIISNVEYYRDDGTTYIQTIESVASGVKFGFLDDKRMVDYNVEIFKVADIASYDRTFIVDFCLGQIGKPYSCEFNNVDWSSSNPDWYCSELVYAAYYSAMIDLGWRYVDGGLMTFGSIFFPEYIKNAYNTYQINMESAYFPSFLLVNESNWTIRIYNTTPMNNTFYYNSKMCFGNDAEKWVNLNDVKSLYIYKTQYEKVRITTNWFATDIAISTIVDNKRYITFANNLNTKTYKTNLKYSIVGV